MSAEINEIAARMLGSDTDSAHPAHDSDIANEPDHELDALNEAFDDEDFDDEADEGEEKKADTPDGDSEEGAAPDGEETPEDEDDGGEDQPGAEAADDELADVDEATYSSVQAELSERVASIDTALRSQFNPVLQQIVGRAQVIKGRLDEISAETTNEDGYTTPLTAAQHMEISKLVNERQELFKSAQQLDSAFSERLANEQREAQVQANLKVWPQLKKYEQEYRHCLSTGMDCSDPNFVYKVCRSMRAEPEKTTASKPAGKKPAPAVSKADIERAAVAQSIEKKKRGVISAGSKAGGASKKTSDKLPAALKAEMDSFSKHFRGDE